MSFMTEIWKAGMMSQSGRDAEMRARVAETSINAQKVVDAFDKPEVTIQHSLHETSTLDRPMYGLAHADVKHTDGGTRSTYLAAKFYADENKRRRDELMGETESTD